MRRDRTGGAVVAEETVDRGQGSEPRGRLDRLDHLLEESGCEVLLVLAESARDPDLAPFVGPVHLGTSLLVAPRGGEVRLGYASPMERGEAAATGLALLDPESLEVSRRAKEGTRYPEMLAGLAERALELAGVEAPCRVALAGHGGAGDLVAAGRKLAAAGFTLVPGNELVLRLRQAKTRREVEAIRHAACGAVAAMRRVAEVLAAAGEGGGGERGGELWLGGERLTVARLRSEVAAALAPFGLDQPVGNLIAPAEEGAVPHNTGSDERVLASGESLIVDVFPRGWMWADVTRTFCVGRAPEALVRAHAAVRDALELARRGTVPGVRGWDVQRRVCDLLAERGYRTSCDDRETTVGYVHNLGHGVGHSLHEHPLFRKEAGEEGVVGEEDVLTLEPGLYEPEEGWAVRLEDLVRVRGVGEGLEDLTPLPYEMDPRAWG